MTIVLKSKGQEETPLRVAAVEGQIDALLQAELANGTLVDIVDRDGLVLGGTGSSPAQMHTALTVGGSNPIRLDELAAPTADVSFGGRRQLAVATPTSPTDGVNKQYADAIATGLDIKLSVRVATTANITLANTQTIDGVAVAAGNRVLVKNQTTASQNGIYDVVAGGAWTRSSDADSDPEVTAGLICFVSEGTVNANQQWALATDDPIVLGTTALVFTQFVGAAAGGGHTIQDEGAALPQRAALNFVGSGVNVTDISGVTQVSVPGAGTGNDIDNALTWRLNGTHNAGVTSVIVKSAPLAVGANLGFLVIDPYTIECEIRKVTNITGNTFTVGALTYNHLDGDVCIWHPGGLLPWSWWGAKPGNSAFSSDNVLAFNRLSQQLYNLLSFFYGGILIPVGAHFVDNQLRPERDQVICGVNIMSSKVQAHTTFPFSGTETSIFHPKRDGVDCTFATGGASARWIFRDLFVDGNNVAGANGIMSSPQQPDAWQNVRVDKCPGYGIGLSDVQQHIMKNLEFDQCGISIRLRSARFVWVDGFNSEHCTDRHVVMDSEAGGAGCFQNHFDNVHIEQGGSSATIVFQIDHTGASGADSSGFFFDNVWLTNSGTITLLDIPYAGLASGYRIANTRMYGSPSLVTAIHDAARGETLNAFTDFNARIYDYQAGTPFFAGASSPYGAPTVVVKGSGSGAALTEARISATDSGSSYHTPSFYSKRGSGNDKHMVCLDSGGVSQFEIGYAGGITVGGGQELKKILSATATYDPPSVAAGATWTTTVAVTGATVANSVARASHSQILAGGWILYASVTASGTVTVTAINMTGSTVDLASGTLRVVVEMF